MKTAFCRGCQSTQLFTVHDFGHQPLAGHYPTAPESVHPAIRYGLDLSQCEECALLQVTNVPPIEEIFHDDYRYSSSTVPALVRHFDEYADWIGQLLPAEGLVFEFGCNDGVLLAKLQGMGITCAGIDASDNVADLARTKGLQVATGFLTEEYVEASGIVERYDLVTCSNVFAHIHDLQDTISAVTLLLKPEGLFAVEVHDGELIRSENQFDTVYHEHLTYFTEETLGSLLQKNGFEFVSCERAAMHGGGLRCLVRKRRLREHSWSDESNLSSPIMTCDFIEPSIKQCQVQLEELHEMHGPLVGYGAAGRSQMLVNVTAAEKFFCRIYDDSPFRQNRYVAGTDIPILPFTGEPSECLIILAWNYADDIARKVKSRFNKIVTLLPQFKIW